MNKTPIIRTAFPYLTDNEKEYLKNLDKKLNEKNMTHKDNVREIFSKIGIDADLDEMIFKKISD